MKIKLLVVMGLGIFILSIFVIARAQVSPTLLLTWNTNTFTPPSFAGRALPTRGSTVRVSLAAFQNNSFLDLSTRDIRWFVENESYQSGKGGTSFSFTVPTTGNPILTVKAVILGNQSNLEKEITIPVKNLEVVLDAPYPHHSFSPGTHFLRALPYYWSVSRLHDLVFRWSANNIQTQGAPENPDELELDVSGARAGDTVTLSVGVTNPLNALEVAAASTEFIIR